MTRKSNVDVTKCYACHAKWTSMSPSATLAMQRAAAPDATKRATRASPGPQGLCVPRKSNVDVSKCHACDALVCERVVCERALCDKVVWKCCVWQSYLWQSGGWQSCMKEMCGTKLCATVCAKLCVTKLRVKELCAGVLAGGQAGGRECATKNTNPTQRCGEQ